MRVCACVRLRAGHVLGCLLGGAIDRQIDRETDEIDGAISSEIDSETAYDIDIEIDTGIDGGIDSEGPLRLQCLLCLRQGVLYQGIPLHNTTMLPNVRHVASTTAWRVSC